MRAKSLLKDFFNVAPVKCSRFAGDRACIICDNRKDCPSIERRIRDFGDVRITVIGNSAMLSIVLPLKTDIEQFMWEKLVNAFEQNPELLIIKPELGFDLTFYTKYGHAIPKEQQFFTITRVLDFLSENPWIKAKMFFNKWIEEMIDKLNLQIRRDLPKITLRETPKIERSKIFEPKYKILTDQASLREEEKEEHLIEEKTQIIQEHPSTQLTEPISSISNNFTERSKLPKQPFFITARERDNEYAVWPSYIKREEPEDKQPVSLEIPSVLEATKKIGPEKPVIDESYIPKREDFHLKIFEKKEAEIRAIPPIPTEDPFEVLIYLENLIKKDYEMRKLAETFEQGMESIRQTLFYTDFLTEMSKVVNLLKRGESGLTLSKQIRKDILNKISKWKASAIWKSNFRRKHH